MSKLPDPTKSSPEAKAVYEKIDDARGGHRYPGLFAGLSNYPELAEAFSDFGEFLRFKGELPADVREVAILTIASQYKASYIWQTHLPNAEAAGLSPECLTKIQNQEKLDDEPFYDRVQQLVNVFLSRKPVPQSLQDDLIQVMGLEAFLQLAVVINYYQMISGLIFGFEFSLGKNAPDPFE